MKNSLTQYLFENSEKFPDKTSIIDGDRTISFAELISSAKKLAYFFTKNGVRRGDRVVVCLKNSIETVICFWAALIADATVSIIDNKQSIAKVKYITEDSAATVLVVHDQDKMPFLDNVDSLFIVNFYN